MSLLAPTHAGSVNRRAAGWRGAPAFRLTFSARSEDFAHARLDYACSFICLPDPGPLASMKDVARRLALDPRVRGGGCRVAVWRWRCNRPCNSQASDITGELCQVAELQRISLAREACAHLRSHPHIERYPCNSATLQPSIYPADTLGFLGCRPVAAGVAGCNSASNIKWGGYASAVSIRADLHRFAGAAPQNFRDRARLALPIGAERAAIDVAQPVTGNGGNPPFSLGPCGAVGMAVLEWTAESVADQPLSLGAHKLVRLGARDAIDLGKAGGPRSRGGRGGTPIVPAGSRRMLPCAVFRKRIGFPIVGDTAATGNLSGKKGSGVRVSLRLDAAGCAKRQPQGHQDRVRVQVGVLVPPAYAGGTRTLAREVSHVNG